MSPESEVCVSNWITALRHVAAGTPAQVDIATQNIWERYFERLARHANRKLRPSYDGDGKDVAVSVFASFFRGATAGRVPQLAGPHALWPLMVVKAAQKIHDRLVRRNAKKRGGGWTNMGPEALESVLGRSPSPELAAEVDEEYRRLLDVVDGDDESRRLSLRQIAIWKLEGYTIADPLLPSV